MSKVQKRLERYVDEVIGDELKNLTAFEFNDPIINKTERSITASGKALTHEECTLIYEFDKKGGNLKKKIGSIDSNRELKRFVQQIEYNNHLRFLKSKKRKPQKAL